jgi:hypothetical protein
MPTSFIANTPQSAAPAAANLPDDISGAISAALNILDQWQLDRARQCTALGISERSWYDWKRQAPAKVGRDTLERVSYILGIWKALRLLLPDQNAYKRWPHLPNQAPLFAGQPPIERMSAGQVADLYVVRDWLDGWRG